jgi:hypothetical protein
MLVRVCLGFGGRDFRAVIAWGDISLDEETMPANDQIKKSDGSAGRAARNWSKRIVSILAVPRTRFSRARCPCWLEQLAGA